MCDPLEEHDSAVAKHVAGRYPWHEERDGWALDLTDDHERWYEPWWQVLVVWSATNVAVIGRAMASTLPAIEIRRVCTAKPTMDEAMRLAEECYAARMRDAATENNDSWTRVQDEKGWCRA